MEVQEAVAPQRQQMEATHQQQLAECLGAGCQVAAPDQGGSTEPNLVRRMGRDLGAVEALTDQVPVAGLVETTALAAVVDRRHPAAEEADQADSLL